MHPNIPVFMFGTKRGRLPAKEVNRREQIAKKHNATFIHCKLPDGWTSWFEVKNMGSPFNEDRMEEVMKDVYSS